MTREGAESNFYDFLFFLSSSSLSFGCGRETDSYRRGRPTSVVLLLLVVVPKLPLPLGSQSPLGLHHLLRLVGAARGLVTLGSIEGLQVGGLVRAARIVEVDHGVGTGTRSSSHAAACYHFTLVG